MLNLEYYMNNLQKLHIRPTLNTLTMAQILYLKPDSLLNLMCISGASERLAVKKLEYVEIVEFMTPVSNHFSSFLKELLKEHDKK